LLPLPDVIPGNLSRDDLQQILDNSFDEIFVVNSKGIVVYVNDACERHYGLKPSDIIGKSIYSLSEEGYYAPAIAPVVFAEKKRITLEQQTNLGKKLVVTATPVIDDEDQIHLVVMNGRDMSQIEELKLDLENTKQLAEQYRHEVQRLRLQETSFFEGYKSHNKKMMLCLAMAHNVANVDSTVLILGESGTGKNILATSIHKISKRQNGPFFSVNCATIPDHLMESELFGYCRGAFTGAEKNGKTGLVELAHNGTLFLDEIGEIPYGVQAKLLQLIQEHQFLPIGGNVYKKVDIRIIAATNQNLELLVKEGKFRNDLYYRLNVIEIELPPLRERDEDIIPLLYYFLNKYDSMYKTCHQFSLESLDILYGYSWPGNIRELEHLVERLVITVPETYVVPEHLPKNILKAQATNQNKPVLILEDGSLKEAEEKLIIRLYNELKSTYKVAEALKISQSKVYRVIRNKKDEQGLTP
jgi:PAS domain S-box-containing protein